MKLFAVLFLYFVLVINAYTQVITGTVIDAIHGTPLAYVSIGVIDSHSGTITNEKGFFKLEVRGFSNTATVRFSMIGFRSRSFTIGELLSKENIIKLENEPILLKEVVIKPVGKFSKVGATSYTWHGGWCGWGGTEFGKGHEIGLIIDLGSRPVRIRSLHLHLDKQSFDSSLFRLHIRDISDDLPDHELLDKNIFVYVNKESGWVDIELAEYNLVFQGPVALSIEWIKIFGVRKEKLVKMNGSAQYTAVVLFNIKKKQGCTYTRWGSEAKWVRTANESPAFYLVIEE